MEIPNPQLREPLFRRYHRLKIRNAKNPKKAYLELGGGVARVAGARCGPEDVLWQRVDAVSRNELQEDPPVLTLTAPTSRDALRRSSPYRWPAQFSAQENAANRTRGTSRGGGGQVRAESRGWQRVEKREMYGVCDQPKKMRVRKIISKIMRRMLS